MSSPTHDAALYQGLFRTMTEGCAVHELVHDDAGVVVDYRILDVNDAYVGIVGLERDAVLGRTATEVYGTHAAPYLERYARVAMTGEPDRFEVHFRPMAKHFRISVFSPRLDAFVTVFSDITREKEEAVGLEELADARTQQLQEEVAHHLHTRLALQQSEARLRAIFGALPDLVFLVDADGRYREVLTGEDELLVRPKEEVRDPRLQDIFAPALAERFMGLIRTTIDSGATQRIEYALELPDGVHHFEGLSAPLDEPVEGRRAIVFVARDITEQRLAEQEVRELNRGLEARVERRTVALQAANKELEAFAYSVSHDLRAPLRAIDGFSRAVLEDYGGRLDEDGREYLERLCGASQRMGWLIDDLLRLSRLTRRSFEQSRVDLSGMAESILGELLERDPQRKAEIHVDPEIAVAGDSALLRVAMQNLLDNAWKFTGQRPVARIRVGGRVANGELAVSVSDNGAGFDMSYVGKLFGPFQRLHGVTEFPGNGIGLATVHRAILRHGGRVHAEGRVGEGATFTFILPSCGLGPDSVPLPGA